MHPETFDILMKNMVLNSCKDVVEAFNIAAGAKEDLVPYFVLPKGDIYFGMGGTQASS